MWEQVSTEDLNEVEILVKGAKIESVNRMGERRVYDNVGKRCLNATMCF